IRRRAPATSAAAATPPALPRQCCAACRTEAGATNALCPEVNVMQSWWMQMTDSATTLERRDAPMPVAGPTQLLVRMRAAALNRGEFLLGHGLHGQPGSWKAIGGEGAGEVVAVGAGARGFRPGDRVMGRCAGAFS